MQTIFNLYISHWQKTTLHNSIENRFSLTFNIQSCGIFFNLSYDEIKFTRIRRHCVWETHRKIGIPFSTRISPVPCGRSCVTYPVYESTQGFIISLYWNWVIRVLIDEGNAGISHYLTDDPVLAIYDKEYLIYSLSGQAKRFE